MSFVLDKNVQFYKLLLSVSHMKFYLTSILINMILEIIDKIHFGKCNAGNSFLPSPEKKYF